MTEAPDKTEAKQVTTAKALASQRERDVKLLAQVGADSSLFAAGAVKQLEARIERATSEIDKLPDAVKAKAMTPGQLIGLVTSELEGRFKAWYPNAFLAACEKLNISEQAIAGKGGSKHSFAFMGHYDHKNDRVIRRPKLEHLVTVSRKGLS